MAETAANKLKQTLRRRELARKALIDFSPL
jgi:hypothetical protein